MLVITTLASLWPAYRGVSQDRLQHPSLPISDERGHHGLADLIDAGSQDLQNQSRGVGSASKGIDLQVGAGEFVGIVGPSGSGKSTLINMITGIDRPTSGRGHRGGERLTHMSENRVAKWRGRNVGVVFQFFQLLPTLTVLENVMMPMHYTGTYNGQRRERALELLELVDMPRRADKYPSQISGGQQQRAAIARALVNDPESDRRRRADRQPGHGFGRSGLRAVRGTGGSRATPSSW